MNRETIRVSETIKQNTDNTTGEFKIGMGKVVDKLNFLTICCVASIVLLSLTPKKRLPSKKEVKWKSSIKEFQKSKGF